MTQPVPKSWDAKSIPHVSPMPAARASIQRGVRPALDTILPPVPKIEDLRDREGPEATDTSIGGVPFLVPSEMVIVNGRFDAPDLDFLVRGKLSGDMSVRTLIVEAGGEVRGRVIADDVLVHERGLIAGDVTCNRVSFRKGSTFTGNLTYGEVICRLGSVVEGTLTRKVPST